MASTEIWKTTENYSFHSSRNTSTWGMYSGNFSLEYAKYYMSLADDINFYGLSIVIPFGLIGNVFSIFIFLTSSLLRRTATGQYLIALACADSLLLIGDLMRWMAATRNGSLPRHYFPLSWGLNAFHTSNSACQITNFLRYGSSRCSAWITIAIAIERLVVVAMPLMVGRLSNPCRVRSVIISIATVSYSVSVFPFWMGHIDTGYCQVKKHFIESYKIWVAVVIEVFILALPGVLIAILTVVLIWFLFRARRQRLTRLSVTSTLQNVPRSGISRESQLTVMLLAVCIATTALRVPYSIAYRVISRLWEDKRGVETPYYVQTYMAYKVTDVFSTCNYAINFILYCFTGSLFRNQIKKLCSLCRRKNNGSFNSTSSRPTETSPQNPTVCIGVPLERLSN